MSKVAADPQIYQSRFKFYLRSSSERVQEQAKINSFCEEITTLRKDFCLRPCEHTLLFILAYLETRAPGEWFMKTGQAGAASVPSVSLEEVARGPYAFLQKFSSHTLMDIVQEYRPRHLPAAIFDILAMWHQERADLILVEHVPSSLEMLKAQCVGQRFLTLDDTAARAGLLVDGRRDAFEFVLHDLAHAHQFYKNPKEFLKQKDFFQRVLLFLQVTQILQKSDDLLREALDYLISDMNSHSQHLRSYLLAQLIQWRLRLENKSGGEEMSSCSREWVERQFEAFFLAEEPQSVTVPC